MRLVLDWDGTVTERDTLHMTIERFGDLEVFREMEAQDRPDAGLNEVIAIEMETITAPFDEVLGWLLDVVEGAAGASPSSSPSTTRSSSRPGSAS